MADKKTHKQFIQELKKINPSIFVIEKYQGARTPILVSCNACGHIWKAAPTNLFKNRQCPTCSYKSRGVKHRITSEEFASRMRIINPNIELLEPYIKSEEFIKVKCSLFLLGQE